MAAAEPWSKSNRLRLALGVTEMIGAVVSAGLLIAYGMNKWALIAVIITCTATTASVMLFGKKRGEN